MSTLPGRRRTWLGALVAVVLGVAAPLWLVPPASAAPDPAAAGFAGCLVSQKRGDLVLLFDQSDSVSRTDPQDARITAARNLVRQLSRWATEKQVDLNLSVAGFAANYATAAAGWVPARDVDAATRLEEAITEVAVEDGFETDYWNGLEGARAALADQVGAEQSRRCQAVVWFSDGAFALNPRTTPEQVEQHGELKAYAPGVLLRSEAASTEAQDLGIADLCRSGGPANQLRAAGVTIFGIGLSAQSSGSFALMRRVTENVTGDCGSLQEPPGRFWPVSNVDQLIAAFDQVLNNGQQLREFVLDQALTRVHILGTGAEGLTYELVGPNGERLPLGKGDADDVEQVQPMPGNAGVTVRWTWLSPGSVVVDLERAPDQNWVGLWQVAITDAANDPSGDPPLVSFTGDLFPLWSPDNAPLLVRGQRPQVQLGLSHANGEPFPVAEVPGELSLSAVLVDSRGRRFPIVSAASKQRVGDRVDLDLTDATVGDATVEMSLAYTTAPVNGQSTPLDPQELPVAVRILPPPDRGEVIGVLDFGVFEGVADRQATVTVTGPSCVWINGPATTTANPAGVTPILSSEHNSADNCRRVDAGDSSDFPVLLRTDAAGNGGLRGTVPVSLAPLDEPAKAVAVDVAYRADMRKPIDLSVTAGVFALALLLGIGLPLGLLYLVKWLTARMPNRALEAVRIPIAVSGGQVLTQGQPLTMENVPSASPVVLGRGRRLADAAGVTLRTRTGLNPITPSWVAATLPGHVGVSSTDNQPRGPERAAALPLGVHNTWAVFHNPAGPPDRAELLVLRGLDITDGDRRNLLEEARRGLPDLLPRLRAEAGGPGSPPPSAGGGWDSGSFGTPSAPAATGGGGDWGGGSFSSTSSASSFGGYPPLSVPPPGQHPAGPPAPPATTPPPASGQPPGAAAAPSWSGRPIDPGPPGTPPTQPGRGGPGEQRQTSEADTAPSAGPVSSGDEPTVDWSQSAFGGQSSWPPGGGQPGTAWPGTDWPGGQPGGGQPSPKHPYPPA